MDSAESTGGRRDRIRIRKLKRALRFRKKREQRDAERRVEAYRLILTSDPRVAAQPYETPDPAWSFPYGAHWRICRKNLVQLVAMSGRLDTGSVRNWVNDDVFLLRLDVLLWPSVAHRYWDDYDDEREAMTAYLRPGREHWGAADPDLDDEEEEWAPEESEEVTP